MHPDPIIEIRPQGNIANRLIQYMGALRLVERLGGGRISNFSVPEWEIDYPKISEAVPAEQDYSLYRLADYDLDRITRDVSSGLIKKITIRDYMQRLPCLGDVEFFRSNLPRRGTNQISQAADTIVINIRAAELLAGIAHYPLIPIQFYRDIIDRMALRPIFMGQIDDSDYTQHLRNAFPDAEFHASHGWVDDFETIRSAHTIVTSVSTFAWLASWLSNAETIILPLTGFFNPAHLTEIDLVPTDDVRFRFFLFPLNFGIPWREAVVFHERMAGTWREISPLQVQALKSPSRIILDNPPDVRIFDEIWYCHRYLDAAMEISEGWYPTALDHYRDIGWRRGNLPCEPELLASPRRDNIVLFNIALHKPATQSSTSAWSRSSDPGIDAAGAVNGQITGDIGFHTALEDSPWWQVDLEQKYVIEEIRVFNRVCSGAEVIARANRLMIQISDDGTDWKTVHHQHGPFGGKDGRPLVWRASRTMEARQVRIQTFDVTILHLDEIEVYGTLSGSDIMQDRAPLDDPTRDQVNRSEIGTGPTASPLAITPPGSRRWSFWRRKSVIFDGGDRQPESN